MSKLIHLKMDYYLEIMIYVAIEIDMCILTVQYTVNEYVCKKKDMSPSIFQPSWLWRVLIHLLA